MLGARAGTGLAARKDMESRRFLTVAQLAAAHPAFSIAALRKLLFFRAGNGLAAATIRIVRRVLIDEGAFLAWLSAHAEGPVSGTR